MKRIIELLLIIILYAMTTMAAEVNVEDYGAIPNDGIDDTQAINDAYNFIKETGGGVILFPNGKLNVSGHIRLVPPRYGGQVKLKGNTGSIIEISAGDNIVFYAGNLNILTFEDLMFVGKNVPSSSPEFFDAAFLIFSVYVQQTNIIRCQFYGLAVKNPNALIYFGNTDAKIIDSQFDGSLGQYPDGSVVKGDNVLGLTVSRTQFYDYANLDGEYLSKTTAFVGSWINVVGVLPFTGIGRRRITIEDSKFDEGAAAAIRIENMPWAYIAGISVNVNGSTPGKGIYLNNVEHARIEQSWFGLTEQARPALDLNNVKSLEVTSLKFANGVYFWKKQNVTTTSVRFCEQCR